MAEPVSGVSRRERYVEALACMVIEQAFTHKAIERETNRGLACMEVSRKCCRINPLSRGVFPGLQLAPYLIVQQRTFRVGGIHGWNHPATQ